MSNEQHVELSRLLEQSVTGCVHAAVRLREIQAAARTPSGPENLPLPADPPEYIIPRMSVSLRLSLSAREGHVRGLFFNRRTNETTAESLSRIDMDIVAVPAER